MKYYVINAFTKKTFGGNPAGVCLLEENLPDATLQSIAAQNNLSETAFLLKQDGYYDLRWFTPEIEVDLCGHATLASAYVLFNYVTPQEKEISFKSLSGTLKVTKENDLLFLDFPARKVSPCPGYSTFEKALGVNCLETYKASDFLVLVKDEEELLNISPDFDLLREIKAEAGLESDDFGIIVTAKGKDCDFVSRFFAPNAGINEDPVTGRAHCSLTPFWSQLLGKNQMTAKQLSKREGSLFCENLGERVKIGGSAICYSVGEILIN